MDVGSVKSGLEGSGDIIVPSCGFPKGLTAPPLGKNSFIELTHAADRPFLEILGSIQRKTIRFGWLR